MSVVFSAFSLSYSLFEIPSGWLGDAYGTRLMLTRIVVWWSAFAMLTAAGRRPVSGGQRRCLRMPNRRNRGVVV